MKKIIINIILIIVFIFMISLIVLPFIADLQFHQAKQLEESYRWQKARQKYEMAIKLAPFNAEYLAELGNFMFRQSQSRSSKDKTLLLKKAEEFYQRAIQLNPQHAEYRLMLGEANIVAEQIAEGIDNFRESIKKNPYNLRNNFLVASNLLAIWDFLNQVDKDFVMERVNVVLRLAPWQGRFFYPAIMHYTKDFNLALAVTPENFRAFKILYSFIEKNNLWRYRKQVESKLGYYRQQEQTDEFRQEQAAKLEVIDKLKKNQTADDFISTEEWQGTTERGNIYENGRMYWEGTMHGLINLPVGENVIKIQAKGEAADDIWPYMIVELDGEEIGDVYVDNNDWKEYSFTIDTEAGLKVLSVIFVNDGGSKERDEDRNLYVGNARVEMN